MTALRKELGFWQGLALYLAAVLGTGILVIPSLAWQEAGSSSLIAWGLLSILGFGLAWSFASVGARNPDAGGVQTMIAKSFGRTWGDVCGWLVLFSIPAGGVAASHIFATHLMAAIGISQQWTPLIAWSGLMLTGTANYYGLRLSANAQLLLSGILVAILSIIIFSSLPHLDSSHFSPFATNGWIGIGRASVLIFWAFLGWEAIAHLAEEFRDPRDIFRSAWMAALLVALLYIVVTIVLIGTGSISSQAGGDAPMAMLAVHLFGSVAGSLAGGLAALICLGTMNAYMAGLSRLTYAMARDGAIPSPLAHLHSSGVPRRAILFLLAMYTIALSIQAYFHLPMRAFFLIPNVAFLVLYTLGCYSAARQLKGDRFAVGLATFSSIACALMIPFASDILLYPTVVVVAALFYLKKIRRKNLEINLRNRISG